MLVHVVYSAYKACMSNKINPRPAATVCVSRKRFTFGSPFEKVNSLVSLKHHKTKRREGEKSGVPGHILKHTKQFQNKASKTHI